MTNIFVLGPTTLPILAALWATKLFIPERATEEIKFVKRFPLMKEIKPNDLFVGSEDGLTTSEKAMMNGRMLETFPAIIKKYATETDKIALGDLAKYIAALHPCKPIGHVLAASASKSSQSVITHTSLEAIYNAFKTLYPHGGEVHYSRMTEIFEGMLKLGRARIQIKDAAEKTPVSHAGRIATTARAAFSKVHIALFQEYGVRVIIFNEGYNLGILRHPSERIKLDDPSILAIIDAAGEREEWTLSKSGDLFFRGTTEKPKYEHSRVHRHRLAEALADLLDRAQRPVLALDRSEA